MKKDRRSIRLKKYDYTQAGAYFVTICAFQKECLFGSIFQGEMKLNLWGSLLKEEWLKTAKIRKEIELDEFVVMPNHFHAVLFIMGKDSISDNKGTAFDNKGTAFDNKGTAFDNKGTARRAPTEKFGKPVSGSIPTIVRAFKSAVTSQINKLRETPGIPVWQRNYFEHIIRNDDELCRIRQYILDNPIKWELDRENPSNANHW